MINPKITIEQITANPQKSIVTHLGIEFTEIGSDFLCGKMPVDERTIQPMGILHGGASVVLAETLGSVASVCCVDIKKQYVVGLEINANHIKSVLSGNWVYGKATAVHLGRKTHIWEIRITNEEGKLVCISRITMAIMDIVKKNEK